MARAGHGPDAQPLAWARDARIAPTYSAATNTPAPTSATKFADGSVPASAGPPLLLGEARILARALPVLCAALLLARARVRAGNRPLRPHARPGLHRSLPADPAHDRAPPGAVASPRGDADAARTGGKRDRNRADRASWVGKRARPAPRTGESAHGY